MYKNTGKIAGRVTAVAALGMGLAAGGASVASASTSHGSQFTSNETTSAKDSGSNCASGTRGIVTAVTATSVTVQSFSGTSTTFAISPTTTFSEDSTSATAAALVVGDHVDISASSTLATTAVNVNIQLARLFGKVTAVSADTITIGDGQGFSRTIVVSSSTTYTSAGSASTLSAVTVGSVIGARGTIDANGTTLDASSVTIGSAVGGWVKTAQTTVSSLGGDTSHGHGFGYGHGHGGRDFSRGGNRRN